MGKSKNKNNAKDYSNQTEGLSEHQKQTVNQGTAHNRKRSGFNTGTSAYQLRNRFKK